jgi:hypothetical protein
MEASYFWSKMVDPIRTGKLTISTRTLKYKDQGEAVFQVKNISSVRVEKHEEENKDFISISWLIFILCWGIMLLFKPADFFEFLLGFILVYIGISGFLKNLKNEIYFLLDIELNSGQVYPFVSYDKSFLEDVVQEIYRIMDNADIYQIVTIDFKQNIISSSDNRTFVSQYGSGDNIAGDKVEGDKLQGI